MSKTRRLASRAIGQRAVPVVAALILAAGCATETAPAEYAGICVDPATGNRVDDDRCGEPDDSGHASGGGFFFMWMHTSYAGSVPAVGSRVPASVGARSVPRGTPVATGLPKAGGSMPAIVRGGLGVSAGGKAGGS